jgi:hypothetical protein
MSTHASSSDSFERLLERFSIEGLSLDDWRKLADHIAADENALQRYIEAVQWQQSVAYLVDGHSAASHDWLPPIDGAAAEHLDAGSHAEVATTASRTITSTASGKTLKRRTRINPWWATGACIAFLAGAAIATLSLPRGPGFSSANYDVPASPTAPLMAVQQTPFVQDYQLAKVSGLSLEASAEGLLRSLQVGQELRCGEVVQLTEGFMRVGLHSGPELIIEGPAEFSIIGKDSVFVRVGRVAASGADNLLLQSPRLTAECNAAELLFEAHEDTSTEVYAYKGVVTMRNIAHANSSNAKLAVLHEGQGLVVGAETPSVKPSTVTTTAPPHALRNWPAIENKLTAAQRLVLSDRPVAYWPLYNVRRNRRVLDLSQNGYDGQAIGNWPLESAPVANDEPGAYFNGESYIEPDRKPKLDFRNGFTIEGWAKVSGGPEFQSIFTSRWVLDAHTTHLQCLGFTLYAGKNDRWQMWTGSGRYGELWRELHSDVELERHRWTHVVATFEPEETVGTKPIEFVKGTVYLYVDGKLAAKDSREMSLMDFEWPARIGAAEFVPNSLTAWLFRGHLRDIAVYDYPLDATRIKAHHEIGKEAG